MAIVAIALSGASAERGDGFSESGSASPVPMRALPLKELKPGTVLVAGERLSAFWAAGDSLRPMVHARKPGSPWRLIRRPDPTANGRLRPDWRLPADLLGTVELRFSDPLLGATLDSVRVACAPPAGSPETGPVLDSALEAEANDYRAETNFIPYRSAADLEAMQSRLARADGGAKCLPKAATLRESARNDARAFHDGLPILVSRVRYHFRDPRTLALIPREFRAAGFPDAAIPTQRVLLMLDDAYAMANVDDPVVRVEVRIGQDSLTVRRNAQREYFFANDGLQTVFLRAFTAKGASWEQATVVEVPPAVEASPAEGAEAPVTGLDLAIGAARADSLARAPGSRN